ncbi:hypothetical protein [Thalassobacillus pellis]|uniref:hypothetical protein n=1 Tax=Thalassobacillus pellis TaxID=748008 RepID=UPI00195FC7F0|nr:hypothetical protein [Thalassobacillus pellis]MBM7553764.1 hypothetical protein [Thalassobacillus pellis]
MASSSHSVNIYADAPFYQLFTGKITVILENPYRSWVVNRSVNPTQWTIYEAGATGSYRAIWIQNDKEKWTPYLTYRHNRGYAVSRANQSIEKEIFKTTTALASPSKKAEISEHFITVEKYGNIIKPSNSHIATTTEKTNLSNTLTAEELDQQFFDKELGVHVYALKDYSAGDVIYLKDTIKEIKFDKESNNTIFTVGDDNDQHDLSFAGNITNKYDVGEELKLKFNVENLIKGNSELTIIDYFKFALDNNNKAPNINKFIAK